MSDVNEKYLEIDMAPAGGEPITLVEPVEAFQLRDGFIVLLKWDEELEDYEPYRGYSLSVVERFVVHDEPPALKPVQAGSADGFESLQAGGAGGGYFKFDVEKGLRAA